MLKIGLTGGIGSGKTTATAHFQTLGVPVIDADEISRELVKPGLVAYQAIIQAFGNDVLSPGGELDRVKLRELIFSESAAKLKLEAILHPLIHQTILKKTSRLDSAYCIIAIPLLIELGEFSLVDRVLVIDVEPEQQISRTMQRDGNSLTQVEAIIESQADRQTRLSFADDVLLNVGAENQLQEAVERLHRKYLKISNYSKI